MWVEFTCLFIYQSRNIWIVPAQEKKVRLSEKIIKKPLNIPRPTHGGCQSALEHLCTALSSCCLWNRVMAWSDPTVSQVEDAGCLHSVVDALWSAIVLTRTPPWVTLKHCLNLVKSSSGNTSPVQIAWLLGVSVDLLFPINLTWRQSILRQKKSVLKHFGYSEY